MLRLMDTNKVWGCVKETTPYTAETLTASNFNQRVYDIKISPEIESYARKLARGDYSRDVSISGRRKCTASCSIDLYPGSTVATAPTYFEMIECCGWKKINHGATGISLTPNALYNRVPMTIWVLIPEEGTTPRQIAIKMKGAMGKLKIESPQIGQPIKLTFEFTGVLYDITTIANASLITPTAWDTALPPAVLACTFSFFGTWQFPNKFSMDSGEDIQLFSDISQTAGYDGARVVDRNMMGDCDPDMVVPADVDYLTPQVNNTTGALSITIGGSVPFYLTAPAAQIVGSYNGEVQEGHVKNPLKIEYKRGTVGNDEFEILQGSKT